MLWVSLKIERLNNHNLPFIFFVFIAAPAQQPQAPVVCFFNEIDKQKGKQAHLLPCLLKIHSDSRSFTRNHSSREHKRHDIFEVSLQWTKSSLRIWKLTIIILVPQTVWLISPKSLNACVFVL